MKSYPKIGGRISVKGFFGTLEAGSLLDSRLSVARASEIFMQANYEDEDLRSWRDWDWEMELHEFAEAIARVAVVRSGQAVATVGTAEIVEAVHALMHDELVENLCRSNALDTPTAQVGPQHWHSTSAWGVLSAKVRLSA